MQKQNFQLAEHWGAPYDYESTLILLLEEFDNCNALTALHTDLLRISNYERPCMSSNVLYEIAAFDLWEEEGLVFWPL